MSIELLELAADALGELRFTEDHDDVICRWRHEGEA